MGGKFPQDITLVQEMLQSADLTQPVAHALPNAQKMNNVADSHEVFECHWVRETQSLKIIRIRNVIRKTKIQVTNDHSQMS